MLKRSLILVALTIMATPAMAQTSFFTDRALQQVNVLTSPTPLTAAIPYGPVRVCSLPLTQQVPCLPLATITDINGNAISNSIGGSFGQLTTDATGRFTFGCTNNVTYQVQVAASASNTPAVNYPITCPGGVGASVSANNNFTGNNSFINLTVNGTMLCKNLEGIRCAAQFSGADWCAKATAADSDLGANSGEIWVDNSAGTSACAAAPTLSGGHVLRFIQGGTYNIGVGWTVTNQNNWGIAGLPGKLTTLQFTGTSGFSATGAGLTNGSFGNKIVDVTFSGNVNIANAVTLTNIQRSYFDFSARNCTGVAIVLQGSLLNQGRLVVSSNEGAFTNVPSGGVLLDSTVAPAVNSNGNDIYYLLEGIGSGVALEIRHGANNVIRGTIEGNGGTGFQVDAGNFYNTLLGTDLESNTTQDVLFNGRQMVVMNAAVLSTTAIHCGSTGTGLTIISSIITGNVVNPIDAGCGGIAYFEQGSGAHGSLITSSTDIAYTRAVEQFEIGETAAPACANTVDWFWADSTGHALEMCRGNTGPFVITGNSTTDTLTNKTLNVPLTSGTGLQIFNTTTTCTTAASVGATCTTAAITLPVAEADTSYRVVCTAKPALTAVPVVIATTNSSATQFTITIAALTAVAASAASYDCVAGHN